jgi:hypothetical protein
MRVKTKYGNGFLLGVSVFSKEATYKVLLDNLFPSDLTEDDKDHNLIMKTEDRIYNCNSITVLTDEGKEVDFYLRIEKIDKP